MQETLIIGGNRISFYGTKTQISFAKEIINNLPLSGNEASDRLLIQKAIDKERIAATILYAGNTVYGYEKMMREFRKIIACDDLSCMTNNLYEFLSLNFDIAHYDKGGYISYYDGSFSRCYEETLKRRFKQSQGRFTDRERIIKDVLKLIQHDTIEDFDKTKKPVRSSSDSVPGVDVLTSRKIATGQTDLFSLMGIA